MLRVPAAGTAALIGRLVALLPVEDITVTDPPIDEVIERVFSAAASQPQGEHPTTSTGNG